MGVGVERMIRGQLGDRYSKEMGMNKGGSPKSNFMAIYICGKGKGIRE